MTIRCLSHCLPVLLLLALVPATGCGKKAAAPKTIAAQLKDARAAKTPEGQARALVRVARRQLKSGDKTGAGKTLTEARSLIKPDADPAVAGQRLVEIGDLHARADSRSAAREALKAGVELADKVGDPISRIRILTDAATAFGAKAGGLGDAKSAREALGAATTAAEGVEDRFKVQAFAAIAVALAKVGLNDDAAKLADQLEEMARGQDDPRAKAEALAAAANVHAEKGDKAKTAELLAAAEAAAGAIKTAENKAYGLMAVAAAFLANGDAATASRLLKDADKQANKVADPEGQKNAIEKVRAMMADAERKK